MVNFETGSSLADFQDALYQRLFTGGTVSSTELTRLASNLWVRTAAVTAPGNLVVRHYCLIDIITKQTNYFSAIENQIRRLTYWKSGASNLFLLWAEGYSYWRYTKPFLQMYTERLGKIFIIDRVDLGFQKTAYLRGTATNYTLYPAPYGDLRDEPLEPALQDRAKIEHDVTITPVKRFSLRYDITGLPIGLNAHIPMVDSTVRIVKDIPTPFTWYTGYNNKYPNKAAEAMDVFNIKRISSLFS